MNLSVRANLSTQNIDGELVILDKDNGQIHQLNTVASFIWQQIENGLSIELLINELVVSFDIDEVTAKTDLDDTIQQFTALKLLN